MTRIILLGDDVASELIDSVTDPKGIEHKIKLCAEHCVEFDKNFESLSDENRLQGFHILTSIAAQSMGTENLVAFTCPVCALRKFDFIGQLSMTIRSLLPVTSGGRIS